MNDYTTSINQICKEEEDLDIYNHRIQGMPIWSSVCRKYRDRYIEDESGVPPMRNHPVSNLKMVAYATLRGFMDFVGSIVKFKSVDNVVYGFPRLESVDGVYVDKFCDYLIKESDISNSYLYVERGQSGKHYTKRPINNIFWIEFIDNFAAICSKFVGPYLYRKHKREFKDLFSKAYKLCRFDKRDEKFVINKFANDYIRFKMTKVLLKRIKAKRVFSTVLRPKTYLVAAAKSLNIPCYEIQHGITEGPTPMYSGLYLKDFSPTAFLAFGKTSMIPVFNVPMEKMINIGFAYKKYLHSKNIECNPNSYLLISDPEITQQLIDVACRLKKQYPSIDFNIRFHPMEKPTNQQIIQLSENEINIVSNKDNSTIASMRYGGIIGEKSSVLYECVSIGKKTGKLFFEHLNEGINIKEEEKKGFFVLNNIDEFEIFHKMDIDGARIPEYYSDFNEVAVNSLLD